MNKLKFKSKKNSNERNRKKKNIQNIDQHSIMNSLKRMCVC